MAMDIRHILASTDFSDHAKKALSDALELARVLPVAQQATIEVTRSVAIGAPSQQVVETAEAEHVDLIVMAMHGRTGLSHLLIGSGAERVLRTAPCPVLTLRPARERS
jgi:nucleotide-binding universal stress UspA family protein